MQFPRNAMTAWSCADSDKLLQPSRSLGNKEGTWRERGREEAVGGEEIEMGPYFLFSYTMQVDITGL